MSARRRATSPSIRSRCPDQREPAIPLQLSSACSSRATSSVTGSTSRKNASCGMPSSACTCWSRTSAPSPTFANIIGELKERLHRWTRGGQYGFLFDNAEDTLSFSRFQTFNFARLGRCARCAGAAAVLRSASGVERDRRSRETRHLQDVPARRGVALHQERDHPQLRRAGAEDLAQAQRRDDPGHAVHQGA
jgi:hypothetical protein